MTLRKSSKVGFQQPGIATKYHFEAYSDIAVDDVIAFMAQAEATRRYVFPKQGVVRDAQTPSDALKMYLMDTEK